MFSPSALPELQPPVDLQCCLRCPRASVFVLSSLNGPVCGRRPGPLISVVGAGLAQAPRPTPPPPPNPNPPLPKSGRGWRSSIGGGGGG